MVRPLTMESWRLGRTCSSRLCLGGFNFEDAILLSERWCDDAFTSIHIEEFEVEARDNISWAKRTLRAIFQTSEKKCPRFG